MNFNRVCRTCLANENLNPIFVRAVDPVRYSTALFVTTGVKVAMNDGLPQQMCARCISLLNAVLKFRKQCKDTETKLLRVKNACDGAAESLDSGALDSGDSSDRDMLVELQAEDDIEMDGGDGTVESEAEENGCGALRTMEEDPCQLDPVGGPCCNTNHEQPFVLRRCFVKIERLPIEDLRHNLHTCKTCLMTFDCESSHRNHSCTNLAEKSNSNTITDQTAKVHFKCDIRGKEHAQKSRIIRHLAAHNRNQGGEKLVPYSSGDAKFSKTEKAFSQKQDLIRHTRTQHIISEKLYSCYICKKEFDQKYKLRMHIRIHVGEKLYSCSVNTQFAQKNYLTSHMKTHNGKKLYSCDICKKEFAQKYKLNTHIRIHTGENPYPCGLCNKQFAQKNDLASHMKTHSGKKLFSCDICKKGFDRKSRIIGHIRIHTGEKPYSCSVCNKQFTLNCTLTRHLTSHTGKKLYSCDICKKGFTQKVAIIAHMRIHTGEKPFACDICQKQFRINHQKNRHKKIHTKPLARTWFNSQVNVFTN